MNEQACYPDCPNCESNIDVHLAIYADGCWIGFECEGCGTVVRELYDADQDKNEEVA